MRLKNIILRAKQESDKAGLFVNAKKKKNNTEVMTTGEAQSVQVNNDVIYVVEHYDPEYTIWQLYKTNTGSKDNIRKERTFKDYEKQRLNGKHPIYPARVVNLAQI